MEHVTLTRRPTANSMTGNHGNGSTLPAVCNDLSGHGSRDFRQPPPNFLNAWSPLRGWIALMRRP